MPENVPMCRLMTIQPCTYARHAGPEWGLPQGFYKVYQEWSWDNKGRHELDPRVAEVRQLVFQVSCTWHTSVGADVSVEVLRMKQSHVS